MPNGWTARPRCSRAARTYDGSAALPISGVVRKGPLVARKKVAQSTLPIDPDPAAGKDEADDADYRPAIQGEIVEVAVASITVHPINAEIYRDDADAELVASVRDHGVTTPIEVTDTGGLISGHRRVSAARQAGLETIPAYIRTSETKTSSLEAMIRANLYRTKTKGQKDREIQALLKAGKTVRAIQATTGVSKSQVGRVRTSATRDPGRTAVPFGTSGRPARTPSRNGSDQPAAVAKPRPAVPTEDSTVNRPATSLSLDLGIPDVRAGVTAAWPILFTSNNTRPPKSLVPNPRDPVVHGPDDIDLIDANPMEFGWIQPVIVNMTTTHLIDGHARVRLALAHGQARVPVAYVDLTAAQEERLMERRIQIRARLEAVEVPSDGGQHRRPIIDADDPGDMTDDDPGDDTDRGPTDVADDGTPLGDEESIENAAAD